MIVSVAFHAVHRRPEVYSCPHELDPERFIGAKYTPYEAVAFGGGTRRCLGMPFALHEMKLVLAALLERYRLDVVQDQVRPSWRGMFLTPSEGLRVKVRATVVPAARA
jgi:cytochrome P450